MEWATGPHDPHDYDYKFVVPRACALCIRTSGGGATGYPELQCPLIHDVLRIIPISGCEQTTADPRYIS